MRVREPLNNLVIRDLMFEVFKDKEFCQEHANKYDFYNAQGAHQDDLFRLVELRAIKKGLIDENIKVSDKAWGTPSNQLNENNNTNLYKEEIEGLWEAFYMLLNNYIIAPGMYGNSPELPFFHITHHGIECVEAKDILPYDIDGYMKKLKEIDDIDEWVEFYTLEALKCYNANCYNAATTMLGLSSETLIELIINEFSKLIGKTRYNFEVKKGFQLHDKTLKEYFDDRIEKETKISRKYEVFNYTFRNIKDLPEDLTDVMDGASRDTFSTFLRLTRNEVAHHNEIRKDSSETLLLFISYIKYCALMSRMLNKIKTLNSDRET